MNLKIVGTWCMFAGLAATVTITAAPLWAQGYRLYVDNSNDQTVSVIDLNSLKVVDDIKIGAPLIHGLALRSDGKLLFVTVESDHTLRLVDTSTNSDEGHDKADRTAQRVRGHAGWQVCGRAHSRWR